MKVLHIIPSLGPNRGGPSQVIIEMVAALRKLSIDAQIVTTNDNANALLDVPLFEPIQYNQVPIRFFPKQRFPFHSLDEFLYCPQLTQWFNDNVSQYDLVHVHAIFSYVTTTAMCICQKKKVPYVIRPLGQLCRWSLKQGYLKKKIYLSLVERANLNGASGIHLTSDFEEAELEDVQLKTKRFMIPNGFNPSARIDGAEKLLRNKLNLPENTPTILFLSRLHPKKGLERLISVLSLLKDLDFVFILAGSGSDEYEKKIGQLLIEAGIDHKTKRVGFVEGELKMMLLQGANLFVLPSQSENFGVAALEALASGTPVFITPDVGLSSMVENHNIGYVVRADASEMEKQLRYCVGHLDELKQKGKKAREIVEEIYAWNKIVTDIVKMYDDILRSQHV